MKGGIALLLMFVGLTVGYLVITGKLPATSASNSSIANIPTTSMGGGTHTYYTGGSMTGGSTSTNTYPTGTTIIGV